MTFWQKMGCCYLFGAYVISVLLSEKKLEKFARVYDNDDICILLGAWQKAIDVSV